MKKYIIGIAVVIAALLLAFAFRNRVPDGEYTLQILETGDVHGAWFDSSYSGGKLRPSLYAVSAVADSLRKAAGEEYVTLLDAGDCLQGDNAPYYYNYITKDTLSPHLFAKLCAYMKYDAVAVGNHDIETGHKVYDKVASDLKAAGIPFLAGNAIRNTDSTSYFQDYVLLKKGKLRVAVLGYTNPNMKEWLMEDLWKGMHFESLIPLVQKDVDRVRAKEKPDVVIVLCHSGTGEGDGKILEDQGLDLYKSLRGVDFVIGAHDHRPYAVCNDSIAYIDAGSKCYEAGHGTVTLTFRNGKVTSRKLSCDLITIDREKVDTAMRNHFHDDFTEIKNFSNQKVGTLDRDIRTSDAFKGQSSYMNFIHYIQLTCCPPARISLSAPLTFNRTIKAGELVYNDLRTIYPYENQICVVKMTGSEVKDYLEYAYSLWIKTISKPRDHVLNIKPQSDARFGEKKWSFVERSYNFDSAGGLNYTVDVTKPYGERINIISFADGSEFDTSATYEVAMTNYRASGGGDLLEKGAGIDPDGIDSRVTRTYPEMRGMIFNYIKENGSLDVEKTSDPEIVGKWSFIPQPMAGKAMERDFSKVFD